MAEKKKPAEISREDAEQLFRVLRALCIIRPDARLHVGGHLVVGPSKTKARRRG